MSQKKIQIIILGDGAVGKTSLLKMYITTYSVSFTDPIF